MIDVAFQRAADRLFASYETHEWCGPVRDLIGTSVEAGYAVQQINTAKWVGRGRKIIGRKVGLTSPAVQAQLGVEQPDFGVLFADMAFDQTSALPARRVHQPRVEAEIAVVLGSDLTAMEVDQAAVLGSIDYIAPALEIVGSRIRNWDIRISDTIADNASSGLFVTGAPCRDFHTLNLSECRMVLSKNGTPVSRGDGAACLGNPLNAMVWLAKNQIRRGEPLRAGEVVLTGALGPMVSAEGGDHFQALISGLGPVETRFERDGAAR